jgi:hypothetical protein
MADINNRIEHLLAQLLSSQNDKALALSADEDAFRVRNYERWQAGFDCLKLFRCCCMEAGQEFQREFLRHEQFTTDPLLGVLMQLHAQACRTMGEITVLLINGYADAAFSRWRTLHEIAVTALLLGGKGRSIQAGREIAEDYIHTGILRSVDGMKAYQVTAPLMHREPDTDAELQHAEELRNEILRTCSDRFRSCKHWAQTHFNANRFKDLQRIAGLQQWWSDYEIASQDVHVNHRELNALYAMSEANDELLLCGPSNSGMTEPAHSSAIALSQVTSAFISTYVDSENCPINYTSFALWILLIDRLCAQVGDTFMRIHTETRPNT